MLLAASALPTGALGVRISCLPGQLLIRDDLPELGVDQRFPHLDLEIRALEDKVDSSPRRPLLKYPSKQFVRPPRVRCQRRIRPTRRKPGNHLGPAPTCRKRSDKRLAPVQATSALTERGRREAETDCSARSRPNGFRQGSSLRSSPSNHEVGWCRSGRHPGRPTGCHLPRRAAAWRNSLVTYWRKRFGEMPAQSENTRCR